MEILPKNFVKKFFTPVIWAQKIRQKILKILQRIWQQIFLLIIQGILNKKFFIFYFSITIDVAVTAFLKIFNTAFSFIPSFGVIF